MSDIYFESTKTGKKYQVVQFLGDKVKLKGTDGIEFVEKYSKELFQKLGYTLKKA